jgi:AhpD family alkylhydroperoxidase
MKNSDKEKIESIIRIRKKAHTYFLKKSEVYRSFTDMEKKTFREGKLSILNKELIAAGISVVINCESCMEWHIRKALDEGATEDQIIEAIEVALEMSGGPGTVSARFAMSVLDFYRKKEKQ